MRRASFLRSSSPAALCQALESRRLLSSGFVDNTFGNGGAAALNFPGDSAITAYDVALQLDGKTLVAGIQGPFFFVGRLNVDGSIDTSFGDGGRSLFPHSVMGRVGGPSVAVQGDGKVVVAGTFFTESESGYAVARLMPDGTPDLDFGAGGFVHTDMGEATDVVIQQDGKIVVCGVAEVGGDNDFLVVRFHTSGVTDFARSIGLGGEDAAYSVAIDYTGTPVTNPLYGSIVAVGYRDDDFGVVRLTPAGSLDNSFDGDGKLTTSFPNRVTQCRAVVIQPGSKIVAVGSTSIDYIIGYDLAMTRYLPNGALDPSFGTAGTGRVEQDFGGGADRPIAAAINFQGGLVLAGTTIGGAGIWAYSADGVLDTRFGGTGLVATAGNWIGVAVTGNSIAPIRRLVVVGGTIAARYVDVGSQVAIGSFDPNAYEAGQDVASIIVGRTVALPTSERVYINVSGTATPPYRLNADYTVSGMTLVHPFTGPSYIDIPAYQTTAIGTIIPINDTFVEGDETITFSISGDASYDIGTPPSTTLAIRDNDLAGGPVVNSAVFQYETAPQRVQFQFSQDVDGSISSGDFQVTGPSGSQPFGFSYDNIANTATLSFSGILPDGDYTARAIASGITNSQGTAMPLDHVLNFFFLCGDADRDRDVDSDDFNIFATNFGFGARTFSQGNFNYDPAGLVNSDDFNLLATNFGGSLAPGVALRRGDALRPFGDKPIRGARFIDSLTADDTQPALLA